MITVHGACYAAFAVRQQHEDPTMLLVDLPLSCTIIGKPWPRSQRILSELIQFSYTHLNFRAAPFAGVMRNWSQAQRRVRDRSAYCQN